MNFALIAMWLVVRGAILGSFWGCVSHLNFALIEICFKLIILLLIERGTGFSDMDAGM